MRWKGITLLSLTILLIAYLYLPKEIVDKIASSPLVKDFEHRLYERVIKPIMFIPSFITITNTIIIERTITVTVTRTVTVEKSLSGFTTEGKINGKLIIVKGVREGETLTLYCKGQGTVAIGKTVVLYQVYQGLSEVWKAANAEKIIPCDLYLESTITWNGTITVAVLGNGYITLSLLSK